MKMVQLKNLVKEGESDRLEFKTSTGSASTAMQTVCAFLNSDQGGILVFGVTDAGKITGQSVTDKTRTVIAIELNKIDPYANIDVQYVSVSDGKEAIVLTVDPGDHPPYTYDDRPYMRNQSTTKRMTKDRFSFLYNKFRPNLWETLSTHDCTIKDLDAKRIKQVINMAVYNKTVQADELTKSIAILLKKMGLIIKDKLTNAAVILFCKNQDKQFRQSNIQLARFRGTDKSEFLDKKYYSGNVFDLYDEAEKFLISALPIAARIVPGIAQRVETPAIPYKVLREALVNALIHRDYSNQSSSTFVAIYDDRVNITNIGALPEGIDLKQLSKDHPSIQRNPLIQYCEQFLRII
jgi:ATP-dependent DNA helicase RecG